MKKFLFTSIIAITVFSSFAQKVTKSIEYSLGVQFASPQGNFDYLAGKGYGISAQAEYKTSKSIGFIGTIGFIAYGSRYLNTYVDFRLFKSTKIAITQLPILVGSKFYLNRCIYASAQAGVSFFNHYGGTAFTLVPAVGAKFGKRLDATFSYLIVPKTRDFFPGVKYSPSSLGLRLAYIF